MPVMVKVVVEATPGVAQPASGSVKLAVLDPVDGESTSDTPVTLTGTMETVEPLPITLPFVSDTVMVVDRLLATV